ncbi:hydroquinone glucosyltransferase-like [Solanum dulcamara]|uniref:hydroquinone glucosyltransferase-like n=1 Tax=Solanum dulcamara TaxID=45834 RepID=UPI0024850861|nr:hydroquinone glucosyltransferase-like [Solanum dulcamara]
MANNPHIVMLPTPGMGHLIPLVEFAKRLILQHDFSITLILPTDGPISKSQKTFLSALPSSINYLLLPPVNFDHLSDDVLIETRISLTITRSLSSLREIFKSVVESHRVVAFVVDLFGTDAFDLANEFMLPPYMFYTTTATMLSLDLYFPELDETVRCEYKDLQNPVRIPGCRPIHGKDLPDPLHDRKDEAYKWILHHTKRFKMAHGIILNSFIDLEPGPIKYLQEEYNNKPRIYPIGPITLMDKKVDHHDDESQCLKWLDKQPRGSVIYISFGSGGTLSHEQIIELAIGLEMSGQRFMLVLRCPNDRIPNGTYFNFQNSTNPLDFLPSGFMERTKGLGLVVPNWAPQVQVLNHVSIGGFLTHCGWNSILESMVCGIPLIAWPLFAEQRTNAIMLIEDLKVALRPEICDNGIVGRSEIGEVVKELMEGEKGKGVYIRMRELKDAATKVLNEDGSSTKALDELASKLKNVSRD